MRKTKIVCTLGPAVDDDATLDALIRAGMDVARINVSHGTLDEHGARIARVVAARERLGLPIPIMLDTKGPEIRTGCVQGGAVTLATGGSFTLYRGHALGDATGVATTYDHFADDVSVGTHILIDDGRIELEVQAIAGDRVITTVLNGGILSDHKGINVPNTATHLPALSEQDKTDITFGATHGVDFIAASFVRNAATVEAIRDLVRAAGAPDIQIIAKIENQEGLDDIDNIIQAADGIMVARGDMGVELPMEDVPTIQKRLIRMCVRAGKPCITATQMLDSMMREPRPTRAEVSDVANAILDGTSAVMLSGETAAGAYPVQAVATMDRIARATEAHLDCWDRFVSERHHRLPDRADAIAHAACMTAMDLDARAIVPMTYSGRTARLIARFRPACPVLAYTVSPRSQRQLNLNWGVHPALIDVVHDTDAVFAAGLAAAQKAIELVPGDTVVLAGGTPVGMSGTTNAIKVVTIDAQP